MIRFAVIADPHVHDCDWKPHGTGLDAAIRSFAETADSTRIFNESIPAFRRALDLVVQQGITTVLLVGDLTDDGQRPNIDRALSLLAEYRQAHGLRVLATPGNHDLFALAGRPMVKGFLTSAGETLRVDSRSCPEAACLGTEEALKLMAGLGYQPEASDLHWESPFGTDPSWEARRYRVFSPDGSVSAEIIDASYLIEPEPGLWVLSLDANVPVPKDGAVDLDDPAAWHDPTSNGWPTVLQHRPHLLPWMKDVASRAKALGKKLVSFSHYPVLDALGISAGEVAMLGNTTGLACRAPGLEAGEAFAATGVGLHFSGHLHVNSTIRHASEQGVVVNLAVPSPVGFGPGLKLVEIKGDETRLRTLPLIEVPGHDLAFAAYRQEAKLKGEAEPKAVLAPNHGAFLDAHLEILVPQRYIPREWPEDMADYARTASLQDLILALGIDLRVPGCMPLSELVVDWYRLRKGGEMGRDYISPQRLELYQSLCAALPKARPEGIAGKFHDLLRLMGDLFARLPDRDFCISGPELSIRPL